MNLGFGTTQRIYLLTDDRSLKLVRVERIKGEPCVTGACFRDVTGLTMDGISRELSAALSALHAGPKQIWVALPCKYVLTKTIEVPSLDNDEIQSIVRLQAVRHTPYSKEEVTVGHLNLEILLERYTKTLLIIGSNENIRKKTNAAQMLGCDIEALAVTAEGLAKATDRYLEGTHKEGPCGCLFFDLDTTDFIAVVKHKPYFIRSIPVGLRQIRQDPAVNAKKLAVEIQKTREAYEEEEQGSAIKFFLLTGLASTPEAQALAQALSATQSAAVERDTLEGVLNISAAARQQLGQAAAATFVDVMSAALFGQELSVDLMPDDLKIKKSFRDRAKEMVIAGVFSVLIVAMIIGIFIVQIYFRNKCLKEMREGFQRKEGQANQLVTLSEENKMIRQFKKRRGVALRALDEFQKILPTQMYVAEVSLNDQNRFTIKGTSELMSMVFSFVTEMENNPYYKGVASDYTKSRKENDKDVSDFGISCDLDQDYLTSIKPGQPPPDPSQGADSQEPLPSPTAEEPRAEMPPGAGAEPGGPV